MAIIDQPTNPQGEVLSEELVAEILRTGQWKPDPALRLVIEDTERAEKAEATKQWVAGWNQASILYQATTTPRYWSGTQVERANVPFFVLAKAVNALVPQIMNGLFYDDPPFIFRPRPGTKQETVEAISDIIQYQLDDISFKEEVRRGIAGAVLYGTNIWKWGWDSFTKKRKYYALEEDNSSLPSGTPGLPNVTYDDPSPKLVEKEETEKIERPRFENITSLKDVLVDPTLRTPDIREAKYVIHRMYMTFNDIDKLRDRPGYTIPSRQEVISWFMPPMEDALPAPDERTGVNPAWDMRAEPRWDEATQDPFNKPLEVLERWDAEKVIIVIQRKKVICNGPNPYGVIPFLSVNWWSVPGGAFWGIGLAKSIGAEQRLQQGITNTWLDNIALALQGVYKRKRGKSVPTQNIRISPGAFVEVDEINDIEPMERSASVPEAGQQLSLSQTRTEAYSGASEIGGSGIAGASGHSNLARTATGASLLGGGQGVATGEFIDKFCMQVFLPFLYYLHEMDRNLLPSWVIRKILNDELQTDYLNEDDSIEAIRNGKVIFDILAGAKLAERRALAQSLPLISTYLSQVPVNQSLQAEKKKVSQTELIKVMFAAAGMKSSYYTIIEDMTPEEAQQAAQNQPAAIQAKQQQAQQAMLMQKLASQQEIAGTTSLGRAAGEILRHNFSQSEAGPALQGVPESPEGFGADQANPEEFS